MLNEALLDFESEADLGNWLYQRGLRLMRERIVLSQLNRRFGAVSLDLEKKIRTLPFERVEELTDRLFDFEGEEAMMTWLNESSGQSD